MTEISWISTEELKNAQQIVEYLRSDDADADDVFEFLKAQGAANPHEFFVASDLVSYRQAKAWWPTRNDIPPALRCPSLDDLCRVYKDGNSSPFIVRLQKAAQAVSEWLKEHPEEQKPEANTLPKQRGRPRLHETLPGETEKERSRRLNNAWTANAKASKLLSEALPRKGDSSAMLEAKAELAEALEARKEAEVRVRQARAKLDSMRTQAPVES